MKLIKKLYLPLAIATVTSFTAWFAVDTFINSMLNKNKDFILSSIKQAQLSASNNTNRQNTTSNNNVQKEQQSSPKKQEDIKIVNTEIKARGFINTFDMAKVDKSVKYVFDEIAKDSKVDSWSFLAVEFTQGIDDSKIKSYAESLFKKLHIDMYDSKGNKVYEYYLCGSISSGGNNETEFPRLLFANENNTSLKNLPSGNYTFTIREKEYLDLTFTYTK